MAAVANRSGPRKQFAGYWLPVFAWATAIFVFSSIPGTNIASLFPCQDAVFHFLEYLIFAVLINRAWRVYHRRHSGYSRLFLIFTFTLIYAIIDELHQSFVPGRNASFADTTYDALGIMTANMFYLWRR
ncbi:MAG: VanZ family protein [Candidatus Omnitrophota bacterium]|jgi:hypothetical protein